MRILAESIVRILWRRRNLHDISRLETRRLIHHWVRVAHSN